MLKSYRKIVCILFLVFGFSFSSFFLNPNINVFGEEVVEMDDTDEEIPLTVVLKETDYEIVVGESSQIQFDQEKTTLPYNALEYHVQDNTIVSVDKMTQSIKALKKGSTKVDITLQGNEDVIASFNVVVNELQGTVKITNAPVTMNRGQELQLSLDISESLKGKNVVWSVSGDNNISVSDKGFIKANKLGESKVTATIEGFTSEVNIKVLAPLNKINFNGEKIFLNMQEDADMPSLIFVPYDTTDSKNAIFSSSDDKIFRIENGKLIATGVGEASLIAQVNHVKTSIDVVVSPAKNESGAEVMLLNNYTIKEGIMTYTIHDLDLFVSQKISIEFLTEDIASALKQDRIKEIKVLLDQELLANEMERVHSFIVNQEILDLIQGELIIHLEDANQKRLISYILNPGMQGVLNLKYSLNEIDANHQLYPKIQTKSYYLKFYNMGKVNFGVSLPGKVIETSSGQMHFLYRLEDGKLIDTYQNIMSSSNNVVQFNVSSNDSVLTFNKIAVLSNNALMITLGSVVFLLIGFGGYKLSKSYKKR